MAGFKATGELSTSVDRSPQVVFSLKSSGGKELKTYTVPVETADKFAAGIKAEEPKLREEAGESDPLQLIKISRCF